MKKKLITTDIDAFNRLFAEIANKKDHVCWMRSTDYQRQLYLSPNFEHVFGNSCQSLYENPESWNSYLIQDDSEKIIKTIKHRTLDLSVNDGNNYMYFRIKGADGEIRYLRDWSVVICNKAGTPIIIAGVGEVIPPEQWHTCVFGNTQDVEKMLSGEINIRNIIENESIMQSISLGFDLENKHTIDMVYSICVKNITIQLSKREAECLYYLRLGKSAKETGAILFISSRTVETHIDNIKQKAFVKTKLELITQLIPIDIE